MTNKAVKHFKGEDGERIDLREFEQWYSPQIIEYLSYFSNPKTANVVFIDGIEFNNCIRDLKVLIVSLGLTRGSFIAKEPGAGDNHFIYGHIFGNKLLVINPIGITRHVSFYKALKDIETLFKEGIFLSKTVLQKDPEGLVSCGPICAELILGLQFLEDTRVMGVLSQSEGITHILGEEENFVYQKVSVEQLLPESLEKLLKIEGSEYVNALITIRKAHLQRLEQEIQGNTEEEQNSALDNHLNQEQSLLYLLLDKIDMLNIQNTEQYRSLKSRLKQKSISKIIAEGSSMLAKKAEITDQKHSPGDMVAINNRKYSDGDIDLIVNTAIIHKKNGFFKIGVESDYLLAGIYPLEEGEEARCYVAVCGAIDHAGYGMPREFFFDKSFQQAPDEGMRDDRKDVFDEIAPILLSEDQVIVKILFPYNILQHHWLTGEVILLKEGNKVQIRFDCHDPFGGGMPNEETFNCIINVITRVLEKDRGLEIEVIRERQESPFKARRQAIGDGVSCGVIVADDILKRVIGQSLDVERSYVQGAPNLRKEQLDIIALLPEDDLNRVLFEKDNLKKNSYSEKVDILEQDIANYIVTLDNEDLKRTAISIFKNEFNTKDITIFVTKIKTLFEDKPIMLIAAGEIITEKDQEKINKITYYLNIKLQKLLSDSTLIKSIKTNILNLLWESEIMEEKKQCDEIVVARSLSEMTTSAKKSDDVNKLTEQIRHVSIEELVSNEEYFPRCEYYARFQTTTIFRMDAPEYWGTYFRSTSRGGNCDRYAKLVNTKEKTYENALINSPQKGINAYHAKTGSFRSPFFHRKYKEVIFPKAQCNFPKADREFLYDKILFYKQSLCEHFITLSETCLITRVFYDNEYPCIMVQIPCFKGKGSIESWYQIAMSYYVAITNRRALETRIPIELVVRSSFGNNIPSVDSTGESFRINVGIVPKVYISLLAQSLVILESTINRLQGAIIKQEAQNEKIKAYNEQYGKDLPLWEANLFETLNLKGDPSGKIFLIFISIFHKFIYLVNEASNKMIINF